MRIAVRNSVLLAAMAVAVAPLAGVVPASAQSSPVTTNAATSPAQAQQTPAGKFVQDLGNKAVSVVANKGTSQQQRDDQYRDLLQSAFDLQTIGHFVLGYAWDSATQQQRSDYMSLFRALVVKIYGEKLNLYAGEKFVVTSVRPETDRDTIVGSQIVHADGSTPTLVDWRVRDRDGTLQNYRRNSRRRQSIDYAALRICRHPATQ